MMKYLLVFAAAACLTACSTDNRERIATQTLYGEGSKVVGGIKGNPDPVFAAALTARFPQGSPVAALVAYVEGLGGKCSKGNPDAVLICRILETASFCVNTELFISAEVAGPNIVGPIKATHFGNSC
jgi:hypothetical protein